MVFESYWTSWFRTRELSYEQHLMRAILKTVENVESSFEFMKGYTQTNAHTVFRGEANSTPYPQHSNGTHNPQLRLKTLVIGCCHLEVLLRFTMGMLFRRSRRLCAQATVARMQTVVLPT